MPDGSSNGWDWNMGGPDLILMPVFADFRYYPQNKISNAVFIVDAGYATVLRSASSDYKTYLNGGPFVKLGAGYKIYLNDAISFLPSINFKGQQIGEATVAGLTVGVGVMF